jgi:Domain of unknown function (DUF4345)
MTRRPLQIASAALGLIPITTGLAAMMGLANPFYQGVELPESALLDTNLRFFGGIWVGLGVAMFSLLPTIERQTALYRAIWGMVFLGGVGRLVSIALIGTPPPLFLVFLALELSGPPLFVLWQARVARGSGTS